MKKLLLSILGLVLVHNTSQAQCSATAPPSFMNCTSYGDYISAFTLNSIASTGNSGCSTNGYNLFSTPVRTLTMGNSYAWTASVGNWYPNGLGIWIDWNNDGTYSASENVAAKTYAFNHNGNITVPYTAVVNTNLRMRVRCCYYYTFTSSTSACASLYGYGETEDYYVYISCPASLPTLTVAATSTYICAGQSVTMTASGAQVYTITGGSGGITNGVGFAPTASATYTLTGGITACPSVTTAAQKIVSVTATPLTIIPSANAIVACSGQPSTITATGASNYTWSPGPLTGSQVVVGPLASVVYTVVGYNGTGCPGAAQVALTANPLPTLSAVGTSSTMCPGRSVTLTANGALGFTWSPGGQTTSVIVVSPSLNTNYVVTGTNSFGCSSSAQTVVILAQAPNVVSSANVNMVCNGGSVTLTGGGANTYSWVNQTAGNPIVVNPTISTTYSVIGTNSSTGCDKLSTVQVNVFDPVTTVSSNTAVCVGNQVILTASGGNGYTWTPGGSHAAQIATTPTTSVAYQVTINSFSVINCKTTKSVSVTVNPLPDVKTVATRTSICRFESTSITASGADSYTWTTGSNSPSITLTPTQSSIQYIVVTGFNSNNCVGYDTLLLRVNSCTALQELNAGSTLFSVYPNPSTGNFKVSGQKDQQLILVNELGEEVRKIVLTAETKEVNVENMATGVYFLIGTDGNLNVAKKIVVTK